MKVFFNVTERFVLDLLIRLEREQFAKAGLYDVLGVEWSRQLLHDLLANTQKSDLKVAMHTLHFGDTLVAIEAGLTDGTIFHHWIIGYDHA